MILPRHLSVSSMWCPISISISMPASPPEPVSPRSPMLGSSPSSSGCALRRWRLKFE